MSNKISEDFITIHPTSESIQNAFKRYDKALKESKPISEKKVEAVNLETIVIEN